MRQREAYKAWPERRYCRYCDTDTFTEDNYYYCTTDDGECFVCCEDCHEVLGDRGPKGELIREVSNDLLYG